MTCPMIWRASVITIFPEMFPGPLGTSLAGKARDKGLWALEPVDLRDHALDRHRTVDDTPAGGGPGMVMKPDVLARAIDAVAGGAGDSGGAGGAAGADPRPRFLLSPAGAPLTQARVRELAAGPGLIAVCGRFEGVDERVIAARGLQEISIGDYVLSGGELAAMVLIDACVRLIPGVMGRPESAAEESFGDDLLEYPHYTKPPIWEGHAIPEVLLSGDHGKVAAWRLEQAEHRTRTRRPDLWARYRAETGRKATEG